MKRELQEDEGFGHIQKWVPVEQVPTTYAGIRPASAREQTIAAQRNQVISHMVRMRWRRDIKPEMMLRYGGRNLSIVGVLNVDERNRVLELTCMEQFELDERGT